MRRRRPNAAMRAPGLVGVVAALGLTACAGDDADTPVADDDTSAVIVTTTARAATPTVDTPSTATPSTAPPSTSSSTAPATASTTAPSIASTIASTTAPPRPVAMGDPAVDFEEVVALDQPLDLAWRIDDPALYVVEQPGRVVAVDPTSGATRVVLDITDRTDAAGEQGLLGMTFSPDGTLAYANYTDARGDTQIVEFAVGADGTFDVSSLRTVLEIDQPYGNHNGGDLEFGPDGMLFVGMGDGGAAGDPERRALDLTSPLGKLLRIDPTPTGDAPYTVPADNPFVGVDGARPEIWSIGLRNPWKFSFDPVTGDLWVADVGQNELEEVNVVSPDGGAVAGRGVSFGWSAYEGTERYNDDEPADGHTPPVLTYRHGDDGCSISGGEPYRGTAVPELASGYVYGDYCSGKVWALDLVGARNVLLGTPGQVTAVADGPDGELYVVSSSGPVWRIVAAG